MGNSGVPRIHPSSRTASNNLTTFKVDCKPCNYISLAQVECLPNSVPRSQIPKSTAAPMPNTRGRQVEETVVFTGHA